MAGHTEVEKFIRELRRQGANVYLQRGRKHYRLVDSRGELLSVLPSSPSDQRWKANTMRRLKEAGIALTEPKQRRATERKQRRLSAPPKREVVSVTTTKASVALKDRVQALQDRVQQIVGQKYGSRIMAARALHAAGLGQSLGSALATAQAAAEGRKLSQERREALDSALAQVLPLTDHQLEEMVSRKPVGLDEELERRVHSLFAQMRPGYNTERLPWRYVIEAAHLQAAREGKPLPTLGRTSAARTYSTLVGGGHSGQARQLLAILDLAERSVNGTQPDEPVEVDWTETPHVVTGSASTGSTTTLPTLTVPEEQPLALHMQVLQTLVGEHSTIWKAVHAVYLSE